MDPTPPTPSGRLLVVKLSSLGDLFHALPAVHLLQHHFGTAVDWVTQPEYVELVSCFAGVDRVIPYPRRSFFRDGAAFRKRLREEAYTMGVDLQGLFKSAMVLRLARADRRIGPSYVREGAQWLYGERAWKGDPDRHAVDRALDVVRFLGIPDEPVAFPVRFPDQTLEEPSPRVALVPCSRWPAKNWPPAQFGELARGLREEAGASVLVLGGGGDRAVGDEIVNACDGKARNLCGETSLVQLGGLLQAVDLVITVDSGPMHMAAGTGTKVLALFGVTDPARTGPYGEGHRVILSDTFKNDVNLARSFKQTDRASAWHIDTAQVLAEAVDMLKP